MLGGGGALDMQQLKEKVEGWSKTVASEDIAELLEGSKQFHELILSVWSLDTSCAVDAAELVCNTLRSVST